jgi:hypothetical protein
VNEWVIKHAVSVTNSLLYGRVDKHDNNTKQAVLADALELIAYLPAKQIDKNKSS